MFQDSVTLRSGKSVFQEQLSGYFIDYVPGGARLVITFESASGRTERPDGDRDSWGQKFLESENYSIIAVKPKRVEWYRGADLHAFFRSAEFREFVSQFDRVMFYGSSMGGYAALAFSASVPGSYVLAHVPQTTLATDLVGWETRFLNGRNQDWSGDFRDAAESTPLAKRVYVTYDPFYGPDARHFSRLSGDNVVPLKVPFSSHGTPNALLEMRALKSVVLMAMEGETGIFPQLARGRKKLPSYYLNIRKSTNNADLADACLAKALHLNPADPNLLYVLFDQHFTAGRHVECLEVYERFGRTQDLRNHKRLLMLSSVGHSYALVGKTEKARKMLHKISDRHTEDPRFYRSMVSLCGTLGEFGLAESISARAQKLLREATRS